MVPTGLPHFQLPHRRAAQLRGRRAVLGMGARERASTGASPTPTSEQSASEHIQWLRRGFEKWTGHPR